MGIQNIVGLDYVQMHVGLQILKVDYNLLYWSLMWEVKNQMQQQETIKLLGYISQEIEGGGALSDGHDLRRCIAIAPDFWSRTSISRVRLLTFRGARITLIKRTTTRINKDL